MIVTRLIANVLCLLFLLQLPVAGNEVDTTGDLLLFLLKQNAAAVPVETPAKYTIAFTFQRGQKSPICTQTMVRAGSNRLVTGQAINAIAGKAWGTRTVTYVVNSDYSAIWNHGPAPVDQRQNREDGGLDRTRSQFLASLSPPDIYLCVTGNTGESLQGYYDASRATETWKARRLDAGGGGEQKFEITVSGPPPKNAPACVFIVDGSQGFLVSEYRAFDDSGKVCVEGRYTHSRVGNSWFPSRVVLRRMTPPRDAFEYDIKVSDVMIPCEVGPEQFTLKGMRLPDSTPVRYRARDGAKETLTKFAGDYVPSKVATQLRREAQSPAAESLGTTLPVNSLVFPVLIGVACVAGCGMFLARKFRRKPQR